MKILQLLENTLTELQFNYMGINYRVKSAVLYKLETTIYVSAVKAAGKTVPATQLQNAMLIYRTAGVVYLFKDLPLRSTSYNGQKLYAIPAEIEAQKVRLKNPYRLFVGARITARVILPNGTDQNISCILKDISMTGMSILCKEKIDELANIELSFLVNDEKRETLIGYIQKVYEFKNGSGFFYGCEFDEPNEIIGKFVAKQQKKMSQQSETQAQ